MGMWDRLSRWADRQSGVSAARAAGTRVTGQPGKVGYPLSDAGDRPSWARPLAFTIDVAPEISEAWNGNGVTSARVSRDMAVSVPAVKRVRDLICATIGTLEFEELTNPGNVPKINDLLSQPEDDIAPSVTYTMLAEDLLFEEVAWWRITEYNAQGWPYKVRRLEPRSVNVQRDGKVYYNSDTGAAQGQAWEWVQDRELIRFDSPCPGMLKYAATTIRNAVAVDAAISRNVKNPMPMGFLAPRENPQAGGDLEDPPNTQKIVDDWFDAVSRNAIPYLNGELQFNAVQWDPEKLGLNNAKDAVVLDIARFGGVDPEELAVSTTSRTYQNSQERRLDLLDFTAKAYITAIQGRLSMNDVTFPRRKVRAFVDGFLRSDTKTRMETYKIGREVGVYNDERIARIEEIPSAKMPTPPAPAAPASPAGPPGQPPAQEVQNMRTPLRSVGFSAPVVEGARFDITADSCPEAGAMFKVERERRKITGLAIPWNKVAWSRGMKWSFAPGSLHWSEDSRVKLDMDHVHGSEFGKGESFTATDVGLIAKFGVARGARGDEGLSLAEDGVYDGLSIWATFDSPGDGYVYDPDSETAMVYQATLRKVALTAIPGFDDARVTSVAASGQQRGHTNMPCTACGGTHAPGVACTPNQGGGIALATAPPANGQPPQVIMHNGQAYALQAGNAAVGFDPVAFAEELTRGMTEGLTAALTPLIEALPQPGERPTVPAGTGRASVTREAPVYSMNGQGHSFVRDAWRARTESDHDARARVLKFQEQTADLARAAMETDPVFAINTGNASAVIPPGFRPDLYVTQLIKGRPMVQGISRGTINDATPFNIPAYRSSSGETATHVEGTNPSQGSMVLGVVTVSPGAVSGLFKITREMADSANPAIDAIATKAMAESYSQNTETQVYNKLNGANGVGGTITAGFVPSGAQAYAISVDATPDTDASDAGPALLAQVRQSTAMYPFRRFAPIDFGLISAEATMAFAGAVDTTGRPLLPYEAPQNVVGTSDPRMGGYRVDGQIYVPAWSMTGNAAGDADVIAGAESDVWCWESPTLMFRFEERDGPANIDLALFGYFAVEILRPIGLVGIRLTLT